jgi:hypothetical protein
MDFRGSRPGARETPGLLRTTRGFRVEPFGEDDPTDATGPRLVSRRGEMRLGYGPTRQRMRQQHAVTGAVRRAEGVGPAGEV